MLTVVLLTCVRNQPEDQPEPYAVRTLRSTLEHLICKDVAVHIADDTPDEVAQTLHVAKLIDVADEHGISRVTHSFSHGRGYGANYNKAMQTVHPASDYVLPLEDDWELMRDLNVEPLCSLLDTNAPIGACIRLGYLGYTQALTGTLIEHCGLHWIKLDPFSAEPHVFAGHPRLETVPWARNVGPWPVGLRAGETEWEVSHRIESRQNVYWPMSLIKPEGDLFVHIGTVGAD